MRRWWFISGFVLAVGLLAAAVWSYGYRQALGQLERRAAADLELASDRLSAQLQRYQDTAVLLADHPALDRLDDAAGLARARALLLEAADKTSALDVMYADRDGTVLVSARRQLSADVSGTPFFQRALHGAVGRDHGVSGPLDQRAYYFAAPDFAGDGKVRGALIVAVDVAHVEWDWRGNAPAVFFTDDSGEVFITNRSELLFWRRPDGAAGLLPPEGPPRRFQARHVGRFEIWRLDWGPYLPARALHLIRDLPVIGMRGEVLVDAAPARRLAGLQAAAIAAICLAFGAVLFLVTERRRALAQVNAVLESRVAARTKALSAANARLRREVAERQEAEAALKRAQADLVQAGKLSALGQMSAGISHELNQPLMAIQQYAENGAALLQRGRSGTAEGNLDKIAALASRMARIIRNLRAFARNESEPMGRVDLVQVIDTAVELTAARLRADHVALDWTPPAGPVFAWGGEVRLGQVFVNLINNAADAMDGQADKRIRIALETGARLRVSVRDTGPGIADPDKIFEPFYSTKEVGSSEGMGLGLSISYGLVQSFGGDIRGANTGSGAEFTVELDRYEEDRAA
ncbi:two-component system, NtrC family, C4-dicarboxylate transport sensor histidine kinase DctB [Cribrihabitans marinus]|uniref:C4-dicarboxylate transport sensor protein DctB n=1 Tax=Cribrihabitans marinus TaxID=1227549 RepID=A0A1H6RC29_9RHOB|nr:ATP-binding protein [Cribrihabitans marinus]GGH20253.1 two-component sensor histidine kinase [Cribrihabitans marinus]SEI49340.1 two-component system, NtrC family, C4-dicarboxylate transport sensor histidine kinase DctB [Cribrihabitans marinus]